MTEEKAGAEVYLILSDMGGISSNLIKWFTWSKFSHIDIYIKRYPNDQEIIGAVPFEGVIRYKKEDRIRDAKYYECYKANVSKPHKVEKFLSEQVGKPYDWGGVFSFLFRRDWHDESEWFCSELATAGLEKGEFKLIRRKTNRVRPQDIAESIAITKVEGC